MMSSADGHDLQGLIGADGGLGQHQTAASAASAEELVHGHHPHELHLAQASSSDDLRAAGADDGAAEVSADAMVDAHEHRPMRTISDDSSSDEEGDIPGQLNSGTLLDRVVVQMKELEESFIRAAQLQRDASEAVAALRQEVEHALVMQLKKNGRSPA